ncbi:hypothetical protein [Sphingobium sp. CAP-1]|uniref:hypothetical protein n=1 Tax=Sphingobium sp. CAP-1 TaxID=2676077 RepID=UPI0012BB2988|nr:hypothetical protein [Sphingobium sp. CAP-1]QGP78586.1 hypothetical protein GL174_06000 [Sphingobium sp. CAP-1]
MTVRHWIAGASLAALAATTPALAQSGQDKRVNVTPYLGVDQVVTGPLKGGGDVLTYTNVTAGVTAEVQTRRVEAAVDLQYNHSFGWGPATDQDVLSGISHANIIVTRGLSLQGGALASRVRTDGLAGATTQRDTYTSQVWSGYVGPSYTTQLGDFNVNASYRLGYARVDDSTSQNDVNGPSTGSFADSWTHSVMGSIGFQPDTVLPAIGLTASAGYDREDASQLDQRFEDAWGRVDATLPVSRTLALVGGVGYEKIQISQRSPELDDAGVPLIRNGRYVTDKSSPRALIYDFDDIIWDAGVLWRPSHRTTLQARVGERYGGMTYQGSFLWQGRDSSVAIIVFDGIDSFGRMITADVAALSGSSFDVARNPFTGDITGCAFSTTGGGQCFNDALSGITDANFRYRGISAQYSLRRGPWGFGLGAGYSQRKFITPQGQTVLVRGSHDENWYGNGSATYMFNDRDSIDVVTYLNYYNASGGRPDVLNYGAFSSYYKSLTRRLSGSVSLGVDGVQADDIDTIISGMGQVGLRYSF